MFTNLTLYAQNFIFFYIKLLKNQPILLLIMILNIVFNLIFINIIKNSIIYIILRDLMILSLLFFIKKTEEKARINIFLTDNRNIFKLKDFLLFKALIKSIIMYSIVLIVNIIPYFLKLNMHNNYFLRLISLSFIVELYPYYIKKKDKLILLISILPFDIFFSSEYQYSIKEDLIIILANYMVFKK